MQKGQPAKSTLFDINLDIVSAESQRHEYEEILISEEDVKEIIEVAHSPDVFKKIVASISPTIYGYDVEKESLALQLFGGVSKVLDDGTRIRGDIHILLVGDPGVAKCVTGDADISMADGSVRKIKDVVEGVLSTAEVEEIDDGVTATADLDVLTFSMRGRMEGGKAVRVWKRTAPPHLVKVMTEKGRTLVVTPTHPLFVQYGPRIRPVEISCIKVGTQIAVSTGLSTQGSDQEYGWDRGFDLDPIVSKEEVPSPEEWVYDLEVEASHNYVANGIVSHNSQMLRYMSRLAPRGIYASGKSSSAAGLCVAPNSVIEVDGTETTIGEFVESRMRSPVEARPGQWREPVFGQCRVATASDRCQTMCGVDAIWRIETPSFLVEIVESSGKRLTLTPETKVWCQPDGNADGWVRASDIEIGQHILVRDGKANEFRWSIITEVRKFGGDLPRYVYDLTVKDSHCFVANGFVVHNTAAAVKDDFGEGRWTLEAGALVLADRGHACVDELDKMTDQDRSSMHEAMESQCYDQHTEVLSESGWKLFKDLDPADRVASLNKEGELYYAQPSLYVDVAYDGEIYRIRSPGVDLVVTPNHNMYVSWEDGEGPHPFALHRMDSLPLDRPLRFKQDARWTGRELDDDALVMTARSSLHSDGTLTVLRGEPIPRKVMEATAPQLRRLLISMTSEGERGERVLTTTSQQLADDVQELALKAGRSAQIDEEMTEEGLIRQVVTVLTEPAEPAVEAGRGQITKEHYRGRIYCVEVPDHLLYVRRKGKAVWCGNTVSVAKAGITATLQCRCSLLGAANPKYGRFQEHQYIAEQINMPPALLSRFDLIFAMTDKPSADKDASITQHILKAHRRGQVRRHEDLSKLVGVDGEQILNDTTALLPALDRDFFRKYVAYSKKMSPVLSDEAMAIISQFYLKIRKQGEGEGTSVPITARQLEAFVRLSEASARARLSPVVTADDAHRSVRIVEYYLRRIAGEGDKLDFDIIATGTSHSQREQIGMIKKMISALSKSAEFKKGVPAEEIYKSALAEGIAEDRAKTLLKRLAQNGEIYQPSPGYYRLASEG